MRRDPQLLPIPKAGQNPLQAEEILTQFGGADGFRTRPRPSDQRGLSLLKGQLSVEEAAFYVRVRSGRRPVFGDRVRYTTAGELRSKGFRVFGNPSRANPNHVRVETPGVWDHHRAEKFNKCFEKPINPEQ